MTRLKLILLINGIAVLSVLYLAVILFKLPDLRQFPFASGKPADGKAAATALKGGLFLLQGAEILSDLTPRITDVIVLSVGRQDSAALFSCLKDLSLPDLVVPEDPLEVFPMKLIDPVPQSPARANSAQLQQAVAKISSIREKAMGEVDGERVRLIVGLSLRTISESGLTATEFLAACWHAGFRNLAILHRNYVRVILQEQFEEIDGGPFALPCRKVDLRFPSNREQAFDTLDSILREAFLATPFDDPLVLSYERQLRDDSSVATLRLIQWLGVQVPPSKKFRIPRRNSFDRCSVLELVRNQPELHRFLDGTKNSWMLEIGADIPPRSPKELLGIGN